MRHRPPRLAYSNSPSSPSMNIMPCRRRLFAAIFAFLSLLSVSRSHESIGFPTPMTRDVACRIGRTGSCPGPCPTRERRLDQTPNNPSRTVKRGDYITVTTLANNHRGGFSRWTLVHVRDMMSKWRHQQNAFLFTCADIGRTKCTKANQKRDCNYDRGNIFYKHTFQIGHIYPDGVYVLGWVWYGGGEKWGHFGDYYDCLYIKIQGGPMKDYLKPVFRTGPSVTGREGKCRATVNRVGICWKEPCPGGGRYTKLFRPWEFSGRSPPAIPRWRYANPYRQKPRRFGSAYVKSLTIRSADFPGRIIWSTYKGKFAHVRLTRRMRSTVTCECSGRVKHVTFYINGRTGRTDFKAPFTIAGDWVVYRTKKVAYAPWHFDIDGRYITLSCVATGYDGVVHYKNLELSTYF